MVESNDNETKHPGGGAVHPVNMKYKPLDVFEKNPLQSLTMAVSTENPEDVFVINEILWGPLFTKDLAEAIQTDLINSVETSQDAESFQLITPYHKGMPIDKYLESRTLPAKNRLNLCYELLKSLATYTFFPPWVQDILIDQEQIVVWDDQLRFNELLIMKSDEPELLEAISFEEIKLKLHQLVRHIAGSNAQSTPAFSSFMSRLQEVGNREFADLQSIYAEFKKVYLYDYYLDKEEDQSSAPMEEVIAGSSVLGAVSGFIDEYTTDGVILESEPVPDGTSALVLSDDGRDKEATDDTASEWLPESASSHGLPENTPVESADTADFDEIDEDMEKNLDLFFNRRSTEQADDSQPADEDEIAPQKKNRFLPLLAILLFGLIVWGASFFLLGGGAPKASFTVTPVGSSWHLKNTTTFSGDAVFQRAEWTVSKAGQVIDIYDTQDLILTFDESGIYDVVLKVMDSNGKWSKPYKQSIVHNTDKKDTVDGNNSNGSSSGGEEKMDRYTLKFNPERTLKDDEMLRTGQYSLMIAPGSKAEVIEIGGINIKQNGIVSIWIASENGAPITLVFKGYNQNKEVFTKTFDIKPVAPMEWEMRQFTVEASQQINRMTISVKSSEVVYLDDLSIDSYK